VRELFAGRRLTLLTLMLGVALGWSLFEIARGIGVFVTTLLKHVPNDGLYQYQPLAWQVGDRVILVQELVEGLIELGLLLLLTAGIARIRRHSDAR
jgi:hypothetical protein